MSEAGRIQKDEYMSSRIDPFYLSYVLTSFVPLSAVQRGGKLELGCYILYMYSPPLSPSLLSQRGGKP